LGEAGPAITTEGSGSAVLYSWELQQATRCKAKRKRCGGVRSIGGGLHYKKNLARLDFNVCLQDIEIYILEWLIGHTYLFKSGAELKERTKKFWRGERMTDEPWKTLPDVDRLSE
jgi:hypothetical protein